MNQQLKEKVYGLERRLKEAGGEAGKAFFEGALAAVNGMSALGCYYIGDLQREWLRGHTYGRDLTRDKSST